MTPRHARRPDHAGRARLLVVFLAPLLVLLPLTAEATSTTAAAGHSTAKPAKPAKPANKASHAAAAPQVSGWSQSWSPPLALLSNYRKCCKSQAGFKALPETFDFLGSQQVTATVTFKTRWVDVKALVDGPNIAQQGRYASAAQFKLQIFHGARASQHRGQCRIKGTTGAILAFGPKIDVADGNWHTITCIKSADGAHSTRVVVIVDGVPGKTLFSSTPLGNVIPAGTVDLGGRSSLASSDSLDGWISSLSIRLS
jgi:hypothetical protein